MSYDEQFYLNKDEEYEKHQKFLQDELFRIRSHSCSLPIIRAPKKSDMMPSPMILEKKEKRNLKTTQTKSIKKRSKFSEYFDKFYLSCPEGTEVASLKTNTKGENQSENSKTSENISQNSIEKFAKLFQQRKLLFQEFNLDEDVNKYKEFEEVKILTKHELKPLVEYFKDFSENYFKEDSPDIKDFNIGENKFSKRISLDEYALLKNKSKLAGENLMIKLRANSILKALELDFHRKSFTCGNY